MHALIVDDEHPAREWLCRVPEEIDEVDVASLAARHVGSVERGEDGHYLVRMKGCTETLPVSRRHAAEALRQLRGGH
jgi:DNA-binding LytR/AlgR family response regulator